VQEGIIDSLNGVDIFQTRRYIKLWCPTYIRCLLASHNWETPALTGPKPGSRPSEPLSPSIIHALYHSICPAKGTPEHAALATDMGFAYRTLLGELLHVYVTARPDVTYAITTLAKFASSPAKLHYQRLKGGTLYLRQTIDWGILFWHSKPQLALPDIPLDLAHPDPQLPLVPEALDHFQLFGYVDASHANDLHQHRSTTGYTFLLSGGVVTYRSKTQSSTATSSTEAEFIAAVSSGKVAKYLWSILLQLGFQQHSPTPICEDNELAINMTNTDRPTERSHHIDIQYFALQDWKKAGHLVLHKIPGIGNPSDALTKAVG
jgi:hypothetical protein